jgi:hypothetical protein
VVAFEQQCLSLPYLFCQTICKTKSRNECGLIEIWWKGKDWHGICCSTASLDKAAMTLFALIDSTNYSSIIVSIIDC